MTDATQALRVLVWHVHGGWADAFVRGRHRYLLPRLPEGGPWGLGRAGRPWPRNAEEVPVEHLAATEVDVVVLQRPEEFDLVERWLGRRPGGDLPAVYVEHNTPPIGRPWRHPLADRDDIPLVHVTPFNQLMWDSGAAPTRVVEHGIVDPGHLYTGELDRAGVVVNEPLRRGRVVGLDLLPRFAEAVPIDVFGMGVDGIEAATGVPAARLRPCGDLPTSRLHAALARRRVYLHPFRWTSLGLSLLEAMHLGLPVVALATTEVAEAVPRAAGVVSTRVERLVEAVRDIAAAPEEAERMGRFARAAALRRYGLQRFLTDWDGVLEDAVASASAVV